MQKKEEMARARQALLSIKKTLQHLSVANAGFRKALFLLALCRGTIIVTGLGKSAFIAMKIAATFTSLGRRAVYLHPVEALHGDVGIVTSRDVLLALSFSGATAEVVRVARYLKREFHAPVISITGRSTSPLAGLSDAAIVIAVKKEGGPHDAAPMASTTATLIMCDVLASALVSSKNFHKKQFSRLHPGGTLGLEMRSVAEVMARGARVPRVLGTVSLKRAIEEISSKKFGITAVCDAKGILCGVITDGDVRRFVLKHEHISDFSAEDAMTAKPKTISQETSLKETLEIMEYHKITTLFVLDHIRPIGIIHMHMIIEENFV